MIKRVGISQKDITTLDKLLKHRSVSEKAQPKDYRNKVVLKPWGYEYLIFENEHVAIWFLHIKNGHSTSMHCHPQKKTCLILLSGGALCNTFEHRNYLDSLGAVVIDKAVFHSTKALTNDGIDVIEIEIPPNKTDLVRLNDEYGREQCGYEGFTEMQTENLERFNHFSFDEPDEHTVFAHMSDRYAISAESYTNNDQFRSLFRLEENELISLCRGKILDGHGGPVLEVGDVLTGSMLRKNHPHEFQIKEKLLLLKASPRTKNS